MPILSALFILLLKLKDGHTLPCPFLQRIDVTEVQIAIIIMYVMSAFGGVALWQTTVTENVIFCTVTCTDREIHRNTFISP